MTDYGMKKAPPDPVPTAPIRFALYRRVSTSMQAERDLSLPEQQAQQREYVARAGGVIAGEYEDSAISGTSADARPAFLEMIAAAKRGEFDVILVHKSDRVFRNKDEASTYRILTQKIGVRWASVTESFFGSPEPTDKLLTGIMESVNEFYVDNLKAEVRKGLRSAAVHKGRQNGSPPYGYCYRNLGERGSGWAVETTHSVWLQEMFARFAAGNLTLRGLTQWANAVGVPLSEARITRNLSQGWNYTTLRRILQNRAYLGLVYCQGEWYPGSHPPLVSAEIFSRVQAVFRSREGRREDAGGDGVALFSGGFLRCPLCHDAGYDTPLGVRGTQRYDGPDRTRSHYITYSCRAYETRHQTEKVGGKWEGHRCPGFSISEALALRLLMSFFDVLHKKLEPTKDLIPTPPVKVIMPAMPQKSDSDVAAMRKEFARLEKMRDGFHEQAAAGHLDMERLGRMLANVTEKQEAVSAALAKAEEKRPEDEVDARIALPYLAFLTDPDIPLLEKRDSLHTRFEYMIIRSDKKRVMLSFHPDFMDSAARETGLPWPQVPNEPFCGSFEEWVAQARVEAARMNPGSS